ncbi:MAG: VCBS domain-containing protein, partial [Serratia fonticola]
TATHTVTITIVGANDPADITVGEGEGDTDNGTVTEDGDTDNDAATVQMVSGKLDVTDVDNGEAVFQEQSNVADGNYGSFSIDANGNWTYTLNNDHIDVQSLKAGETLTRNLTVTSLDGTATHTVTITIVGADDVPTLVADTGSVTEDANVNVDGNLVTSGTLEAGTGGDAGEDKFIADNFTGDYGSLTLDADGNWVYTADNGQAAIQALKAGESLTDTFTVLNADGVTSTTVTITIHGTNDAPEFRSGADVAGDAANNDAYNFGSLNEGATAGTVVGTVIADDPDAGETLSYSFEDGTLTNGVFTINAITGVITLNQDINDADLGTFNFNVLVTDSKGLTDTAAVTINLNNINDKPVINSATNSRVSEEGLTNGLADTAGSNDAVNTVSASGTINITDVDSSALTVALSGPAGLTSGGAP